MAEALLIFILPLGVYLLMVPLVWALIVYFMAKQTAGWFAQCWRQGRVLAVCWESIRFAVIFCLCTAALIADVCKRI